MSTEAVDRLAAADYLLAVIQKVFPWHGMETVDAYFAADPALAAAVELGLAWQAAEAALPDRARYLMGLGEYSSRRYYAAAYDMFRGENISADGDTPAAALRALAEKLADRA